MSTETPETPYCKRMSRLAQPMTEGEPVQEMLSYEDAQTLERRNSELTAELEDLRQFKKEVDGEGVVPATRVLDKDRQVSELTARIAELEAWIPISEAPEYVDGIELARMLVYSTDFGITIGQVVKWPDGTIIGRVEGQCGNWNITHFKWLPATPLPETEGQI